MYLGPYSYLLVGQGTTNRTISEIAAQIIILPAIQISLYQNLIIIAKQLHTLGMPHDEIARVWGTIVRACKSNN